MSANHRATLVAASSSWQGRKLSLGGRAAWECSLKGQGQARGRQGRCLCGVETLARYYTFCNPGTGFSCSGTSLFYWKLLAVHLGFIIAFKVNTAICIRET